MGHSTTAVLKTAFYAIPKNILHIKWYIIFGMFYAHSVSSAW